MAARLGTMSWQPFILTAGCSTNLFYRMQEVGDYRYVV
jgi:hypothetical protein